MIAAVVWTTCVFFLWRSLSLKGNRDETFSWHQSSYVNSHTYIIKVKLSDIQAKIVVTKSSASSVTNCLFHAILLKYMYTSIGYTWTGLSRGCSHASYWTFENRRWGCLTHLVLTDWLTYVLIALRLPEVPGVPHPWAINVLRLLRRTGPSWNSMIFSTTWVDLTSIRSGYTS